MLSFLPGWLLCPIVLLFGMSYTAVISLLIFIDSTIRNKSPRIGFISNTYFYGCFQCSCLFRSLTC